MWLRRQNKGQSVGITSRQIFNSPERTRTVPQSYELLEVHKLGIYHTLSQTGDVQNCSSPKIYFNGGEESVFPCLLQWTGLIKCQWFGTGSSRLHCVHVGHHCKVKVMERKGSLSTWKGWKEDTEHAICASQILDPQTHPAFLASKAHCCLRTKSTCSQNLLCQLHLKKWSKDSLQCVCRIAVYG